MNSSISKNESASSLKNRSSIYEYYDKDLDFTFLSSE